MASEAIEVCGTDTAIERVLGRDFTCSTVVAGVGVTGAVSGKLTLRPSKGWRAQTLGTLAARDAGASIAAMKAATRRGVIFTRGARKALQEQKPQNLRVHFVFCHFVAFRFVETHRRTSADEAMWGITGDGTGPSITTWFSLTSVKNCVTALT